MPARPSSAGDDGPPPYLVADVLGRPFADRVRLVCKNWASQADPTPVAVYVAYLLKYLLVYVGGWMFFCSFTPGMGSPLAIGSWAFEAVAFQKAVAWAMFYELLGLGCSSGPLNGKFWPPIGGVLHFARPGTTKLPLFPGIPMLGGHRRTWLDVGLYLALQGFLLRVLLSPEVTPGLLAPCLVLLPVLLLTDKTVYLAARSEHYFVAIVCFVVASGSEVWIAGCKLLWVAVWCFAATSKINSHFPGVISVMVTNSPWAPAWLRESLFRGYPDDLRPSSVPAWMAHMGTLTELCFPLVLLASDGGVVTAVALATMLGFHSFIALNAPSGMPIDWNILTVYGGFFLFGAHAEVSVLALGAAPHLAVFLFVMSFAVPLYGNFVPSQVSFLNAMRYYAGNWAYSVWLFRGDSAKKLDKLVKASGTMRQQLARMVPDETALDAAMLASLPSRFMHLEGRALHDALPRAVDDLDEYEWMDGEVMAGIVLGWNFGDGHLHGLQLLEAVQAQCGFEAGELRVVMVESQPLFGRSMAWSIADAASGVLETGESQIAAMRERQPWPEPDITPEPGGGAAARTS